ncbi:hypothetical protein [Micromonospora halophytica]|uniref:Uncharacterized protein n=1 Tax=Micromonospora halophytica TaxID=47864 RepID=A0A1C5I7N0_9ACTN|nr:hypothetical protein [Micromonospora halophytica]SCG54348.1 hypothetical protein GA0070560_108190 [Micromonospora halophytica]
MRVSTIISAVAALVVTLTVTLLPAGPAAADTALDGCYDSTTAQHQDPAAWFAPGNRQTTWTSPINIIHGDAFRVKAQGSVRIDAWGTTKSIAGELPAAPVAGGWPAPGAPRYALIARVTGGAMWVKKTSRMYGSSSWFPVGTDSDCMLFSSNGDPAPQLVFTFNDNNLGDNGGGAAVVVRQWF